METYREKIYLFMCTRLNSIFLPLNEVILTPAPIYKGDYKTDLRLALGDNFSPVFKGNINYYLLTIKRLVF